MDPRITALSAELFWDVAHEQVHVDQHAAWLLERVLEKGRWQDWVIIRQAIDKRKMKQLAPKLRISPKARNFLNLYCQEP